MQALLRINHTKFRSSLVFEAGIFLSLTLRCQQVNPVCCACKVDFLPLSCNLFSWFELLLARCSELPGSGSLWTLLVHNVHIYCITKQTIPLQMWFSCSKFKQSWSPIPGFLNPVMACPIHGGPSKLSFSKYLIPLFWPCFVPNLKGVPNFRIGVLKAELVSQYTALNSFPIDWREFSHHKIKCTRGICFRGYGCMFKSFPSLLKHCLSLRPQSYKQWHGNNPHSGTYICEYFSCIPFPELYREVAQQRMFVLFNGTYPWDPFVNLSPTKMCFSKVNNSCSLQHLAGCQLSCSSLNLVQNTSFFLLTPRK